AAHLVAIGPCLYGRTGHRHAYHQRQLCVPCHDDTPFLPDARPTGSSSSAVVSVGLSTQIGAAAATELSGEEREKGHIMPAARCISTETPVNPSRATSARFSGRGATGISVRSPC